jgi:ATP adenylyltransferase/5',5'''-P-1,P-4-tetraphosphate phosphorylase II
MIQKSDRYKDFLLEQNHTWKLSAENYRGLDLVEEKTILIDSFKIKVQFNPQRMRSSAAKVDPNSIAARKCFLCAENRPPEQISLDLGHDFLLLVNPFPIFHTHFTIPSIYHIPQRLVPNLEAMFHISTLMEGYLLFYNGPECGASAPDHLHFQAGETGFLPVESEFAILKESEGNFLHNSESLKVWAFHRYLRKMISLETDNIQLGINMIEKILSRFQEIQSDKVEPMLNLLCTFNQGKWVIHIFPRKQHRPSQFFAQGDDQLLISPASVDFGGVFITPRREDFDKITAGDIADMFDQVTLDEIEFGKLKETIKRH